MIAPVPHLHDGPAGLDHTQVAAWRGLAGLIRALQAAMDRHLVDHGLSSADYPVDGNDRACIAPPRR